MLGWEVIPRIPIGNFSVSPHGIGIAVGYFLGATLMVRRARRTGFDEDHAWNAAVVGVLGAIVGARVAYIIGHSEQFQNPIEYLQIYKGGISLMGGLIGGFLAAYMYCRSKKLDFVRLADLGAPGLAIGTAVGRIGDLVIGDHLGKPTSGFWGWEYRGGELISRPPCDPAVYPSPDGCIQPGMVVHQTALYDSVWALIIFFILMTLDRKPRPKGFLVLTWAALYTTGRIATDFTRVDKTWFGTGLTGSQLTAIVVLLLSLVALARIRRGKTEPSAAGAEQKAPAAVGAGAAEAGDGTVEAPATGVEPGEPEPAVAATVPGEEAPDNDGEEAAPVPSATPETQAAPPPAPTTEPAGETAAEPARERAAEPAQGDGTVSATETDDEAKSGATSAVASDLLAPAEADSPAEPEVPQPRPEDDTPPGAAGVLAEPVAPETTAPEDRSAVQVLDPSPSGPESPEGEATGNEERPAP